MADQGKAPGHAVLRRDALGLAAAVAAFGAALGMAPTVAMADDAPAESKTARTAKSGQNAAKQPAQRNTKVKGR